MTRDELVAELRSTTVCGLPLAGRAFGLGVNGAYEAYHAGEFPVRVIKVGRRLLVPTADVLRALGLDPNVDARPHEANGHQAESHALTLADIEAAGGSDA